MGSSRSQASRCLVPLSVRREAEPPDPGEVEADPGKLLGPQAEKLWDHGVCTGLNPRSLIPNPDRPGPLTLEAGVTLRSPHQPPRATFLVC